MRELRNKVYRVLSNPCCRSTHKDIRLRSKITDDLLMLARNPCVFFGMLMSLGIGVYTPLIADAYVEWTPRMQRSLDGAPSDIASSPDGQWIYILSSGEIAVYSVLDNQVVSRIPVDKVFDRISYSGQVNTLFISSSSTKTIKSIQLEQVQKYSVDGLAFKGPENAPVTIAVFSDYQ